MTTELENEAMALRSNRLLQTILDEIEVSQIDAWKRETDEAKRNEIWFLNKATATVKSRVRHRIDEILKERRAAKI